MINLMIEFYAKPKLAPKVNYTSLDRTPVTQIDFGTMVPNVGGFWILDGMEETSKPCKESFVNYQIKSG